MPATSEMATTGLRRELGRWDLTAIGINQVIGGGIFLIPAAVAAEVGAWAPIAFLLVGLSSLLIALCFAEVGSRFDSTGGPYLYTRAAFGRLAGFEVGWMQWFTRVTSQASNANGIALALGFYWPAVTGGAARVALLVTLIGVLAAINIRGIRQSAWVVNALTIAKLLPLGVFIVVGVFFVDFTRFAPLPPVTWRQAASAALLLNFAFGGYDVIPVPAGESTNPRRHVPFALLMTILSVTIVMALAQMVTGGIVPNLAASKTPVADAALLFMGGAGALLIGAGSILSMTGNNAGHILTGSRMLYALAENRELPAFFGRIHPRWRTPANAIAFTSFVALGLALSGSFARLAAASAVARLITYTGACASTLMLRRARFATPPAPPGNATCPGQGSSFRQAEDVSSRTEASPCERRAVKPATFVIAFGPLVPVLAVLVSLAILAGASPEQLGVGGAALLAGAVLFAVNDRRRRALSGVQAPS